MGVERLGGHGGAVGFPGGGGVNPVPKQTSPSQPVMGEELVSDSKSTTQPFLHQGRLSKKEKELN